MVINQLWLLAAATLMFEQLVWLSIGAVYCYR